MSERIRTARLYSEKCPILIMGVVPCGWWVPRTEDRLRVTDALDRHINTTHEKDRFGNVVR